MALILHATSLTSLSWLHHAFSTRIGGITTVYGKPDDLNVGFTADDAPGTVRENRRRFLTAIGPPWPLATLRQTHSDIVLALTAPRESPPEADALLTDTPSLYLGILTADCVPILLADPVHRAVAAIHAGWRGTAAHIVQNAIRTMGDRFTSQPEHLLAAIGPSIGPCCYRVGTELHSHFHPNLIRDDHLDLWQANRLQLLAAGLPEANIETLAQCTACTRTSSGERLFFSHRAEHGRTGRMMSIIAIV